MGTNGAAIKIETQSLRTTLSPIHHENHSFLLVIPALSIKKTNMGTMENGDFADTYLGSKMVTMGKEETNGQDWHRTLKLIKRQTSGTIQ